MKELAEWCRFRIAKGDGDKHTNHVVIVEDEAKKRAENPPNEQGKRKTRIVWDAEDPDTYALFHKERERYLRAANNHKGLATEAIICALRLHSNEEIRQFVDGIEGQKVKGNY